MSGVRAKTRPMEWRRDEGARRLIAGLKRIGYPESENIREENVDQLFLVRSTGMVLEAVSDLINDPSFPSAEQLQRYEDLKTGGFLDLEPEEEDNTDLLMQIQEEEELCAFYESQLQQLEEQCAEKGRATDVADDSLEKALEEWMQSVKSFLAQMDELKAAILPTDASADDFSLSAVYKRMREIAKEITEKSKAHRDMVTGTVKHNDHLPGWQFEIIPEEKLLFNPLPASMQQMYETIAQDIMVKLDIAPSTKCSDQQWIDEERSKFIQGELEVLLRIELEKLAVMQSLHFMLITFIDKLKSLLVSCEGLRDEIVELTHDQLYPPFQMLAEPILQFPQTTDLHVIETDKLASLVAVNIAQLQSVFEINSILPPKLHEAETRLKQQIQEMTESLQACQSLLPMSRDEAQMKKLLAMES